jgi:hypothetical protein
MMMTPRPIHRWKSFWLGLFVAGFLAWAWWDSSRNDTCLGNGQCAAWRLEGSTFVCWDFARTNVSWQFHRYPQGTLAPGFKDRLEQEEAHGLHWFEIPDLLAVCSYAALWIGWLAWHGKRQRRGLTEASDPSTTGTA